MRTHPLFIIFALALLPAAALAHGGAPQVKHIRFPPQAGGAAWLMDELGLLAEGPEGFTWLCDDSVSPLVGFEIVAPVDETTWVISTRAGIFRSEERGCSYQQVPGVLTEHVTAGLLPHPERPEELVTATATLGILNDIYRSTDGGRTWRPAGLESTTRIRSFLRAEADPQVIYASHGAGASRSDDGGQSFTPIALGPPTAELPGNLDVRPEEFRFLATSPVVAGEVLAIIERFPESLLVQSTDGGRSWRVAFALEDSPDSLVYTQDGRGLLMSSPFLGLFRSTDGAMSFEPVPAPGILGCLTREPGSDRIWACGRGQPIPWVAAVSEDLGRNWEVKLARYADLAGVWDCPPGSATAVACTRQCPPAEPMCMATDGGLPDVGLADAALDQGVTPDADPGVDAAAPTARGGGDDCSTHHPRADAPLLLLALLAFRRRSHILPR